MAIVSITNSLASNNIFQYYAKSLSLVLNGESNSRIGKLAGFERSSFARDSLIRKAHIKMPNEIPWGRNHRDAFRTSDNFLVFSQHYLHPEHYQILTIITPNAHAVADQMLQSLSVLAENTFHCLNKIQLSELKQY